MKCELCGREFKSSQSFGIHLHRSHPESSPADYYKKFINPQSTHICPVCGKECKLKSLSQGFHKFCSHDCQAKSEEVKRQIRESKFNHYGEGRFFPKESLETLSRKNSANAEERIKKAKITIKERYGVEWCSQSDECKDKVAETNLKRYGNKCSLHGMNQEKTEQIFLEKYGVTCPQKNQEVIKKRKESYKRKTGYETPWSNPEVIVKRIENYRNKTGYCFPLQNPEVKKNAKCKYSYDNENFDSSWELAFYVFLRDHNVEFQYHPNVSFLYEYNGKSHSYLPDFKIGECLVEIKGKQFLKENSMINPYDESLNEMYRAKYECMKKNGVFIISDMESILKYVSNKYGPKFLKSCKIR